MMKRIFNKLTFLSYREVLACLVFMLAMALFAAWIFPLDARLSDKFVAESKANAATNFTRALRDLGFDYASHRSLGDGYSLITLEDGRKIVVYTLSLLGPTLDPLFFAGAISTRTGTDQIADVAAFHGALPPAQVLEMILKTKAPAPENGPAAKAIPPTAAAAPSLHPRMSGEPFAAPQASAPSFTAQEFRDVLASPGKRLFPDREVDEASTLVMFTWNDCPSCVRMLRYFETQKERIAFQVLFVPVAGDQSLDASALAYLGLTDAEPSVREATLAHLRRISGILGSQTGKILVPAFAWQDDRGEARIGNLAAVQWRELTSRLNSGNALQ